MSWTETIRASLLERDTREKAQSAMVDDYRRLARQMTVLKERNVALLRAGGGGAVRRSSSSNASPSPSLAGTENVPGSSKLLPSSASSPLQAALVASLESELATTRQELSEQYKNQATNAQRLLVLTDSLRHAEDRGREERDELRTLKSEVESLRERAKWHAEVVKEKEKQLLILQDDHASLDLELSQVTIQNENLKTDNASLLQRWIESKNDEASRMNAALEALGDGTRRKVSAASAAGSRAQSPLPTK